ncbi:MAG: hypothetical protein DI629_20215 [Mesorhizobium amorphae]|nr:MAG: hypothetical protein DI629_20215 [Mesorhizobium amorphae]
MINDARKRQDLILACLLTAGFYDRAALADRFGVTPYAIDKDVAALRAARPGLFGRVSMGRLKAEAKDGAKVPAGTSAEEVAETLLGEDFFRVEAEPRPDPSPDVMRAVIAAVRESKVMTFIYHSPDGATARRVRTASPHAVVSADGRLHARAYDHDDRRFKDFVLGRMESAAVQDVSATGRDHDEEWNAFDDIILRVTHPDPLAAARIARDLGAEEGVERRIRVRRALRPYVEPVYRVGRYGKGSSVEMTIEPSDLPGKEV